MAKMRSVTLVAPRRFEIVEVDKPEVDDDSVIVKVEGHGICGSNLHFWHGGGSANAMCCYPMPGAAGHEFGGVVTEAGRNVRRVKVGDRVAVDFFHSTACGVCPYCTAGWPNQCTGRAAHATGGYVDYLKLSERGLHILPDTIATHAAAIAEPAAAPVSALRRAGLRGGEQVVVLGAGVLGLAAVGAAKAMGAGRVIVTAKYDQQAQFAQAFGADVVVRGSGDASVEEIRSHLDGGAADIVVETVGGHAPTLGQATDIVRPRGEVLVLGLWEELVPVDSWKSVLKDVTYRFCLTYGTQGLKTDFGYTVDLMGSRKVPMQDLVTHVMPLEQIGEAFEVAADKSRGAMKVILVP